MAAPPDLLAVLRDIYADEGNVSISSFWDGGWQVKIGDEWNGYVATETFAPEDFDSRVAAWLADTFAGLHPKSSVAKKYGRGEPLRFVKPEKQKPPPH